MALSDQIKAKGDGSWTLADATTPTALSLAGTFFDGAVTVSGLVPHLRERTDIDVRGAYKASVLGKRKYPTVSFEGYITDLSEAATGTILDFWAQKNKFSSAVSTLGTGRVMAGTFTLTIEGTDYGDSADHALVLNDLVCDEISITEDDAGDKWSFSGTILGDVTYGGQTISAPT